MKIEQMNSEDLALISKEYKTEKERISQIILMILSITLLFIFSSKGNKPSIYDSYGFENPLLIIFTFLFTINYYHYQKTLKNIRKDLHENKKIIETFEIIDKDTTMQNEYLISINSSIKEMIKHKVSEVDFRKLKLKDLVTLEYCVYSKTFLRINLFL